MNLKDFPLQTYDKVRYADTDRQGHVNNANFSTFFETGRVEFLLNPESPIVAKGASVVIAALNVNFKAEIHWPGTIEIGTGILKIGNSSIKLYQVLFQNGQSVADAETVIVQVSDETGKSSPFSDKTKEILKQWFLLSE